MSNIFDLLKKISTKSDTASVLPISYLVVGLGNPGDKYFYTRHNTGFLALDYISQKLGLKINRSKFKALVGDTVVEGKRVLFMKPQTFMNNSGEAVREAANFYNISPENIIVIFDDILFPVGRLRVRRNGSDGGHNGIKSIIFHLSSDKFPRIKVGAGEKPHPEYELVDWVLSEFSESEKKVLFDTFEVVYNGLLKIIGGDIDAAMQSCNSHTKQ
jgi:PTH1 family peptidyl-tRNA hydrolase